MVSLSTQTLPFQISDANNSILLDPKDEPVEELKEGKDKKKAKEDKKDQQINVGPDTRLN